MYTAVIDASLGYIKGIRSGAAAILVAFMEYNRVLGDRRAVRTNKSRITDRLMNMRGRYECNATEPRDLFFPGGKTGTRGVGKTMS